MGLAKSAHQRGATFVLIEYCRATGTTHILDLFNDLPRFDHLLLFSSHSAKFGSKLAFPLVIPALPCNVASFVRVSF